jgi:2-polyprenyl-3-methyl-5-hydroxy-6-metoxy-1,4-benzoquinol methylase
MGKPLAIALLPTEPTGETAMTTAQLDPQKTEAFTRRMVDVLNHTALALMSSIGHRTGLFDAMASLSPATSDTIAEAAGLSERYVREWLGSMVTAGVVDYKPQDKTYFLPREHAACLTRAATPNNLAGAMQWVSVLGHAEDDVVEAFRHGNGVPYSKYHRFHEVMAEESEQTVVAALLEHIVPLVSGLESRLSQGIDVLDIGCGSGRAMIRLAKHFPHSRFHGFDFSEEAVLCANDSARQQALSNVRFEVRDVAEIGMRQAFDLITAFDAIHDQARPAAVLENIAQALRPQGTFLMQDISGSSHVHHDIQHPVGPFLYAISCMHCMSVSLANGGPGLGAMWGKERALAMLREAGFNRVDVKELPHDVMNFYFIASV